MSGDPDMQFHYHHLGVSVPDLDDGIVWYGRVLGFEIYRRYRLESVPAEVAMLRNGSLVIELFETPGSVPASPDRRDPADDLRTQGTKHVAFIVADLKAFIAVLRERGADVVWVREGVNGHAASFIRDHCGNLIEFIQGPRPPLEIASL
jgi:methylmalonyl-CoA/ethylmalonyl-CoA epimerase